MRAKACTVCLGILLLCAPVLAPGIGVSTALFLPRNGTPSHPVSPLSVRDVGVTFGSIAGVAGALSLYNINGLGLADADRTPIELSGAATNPFYALLASVVAKLSIPVSRFAIEPKGGVFGYYAFSPDPSTTAVEAFIAESGGHEDVTAALSVEGHFGWGFLFGGTLSFAVNDTFSINSGALYYLGGAPLGISGSYSADGAATALALPASLTDARLDFSGLEIIFGVSLEQ